MSIKSRNYLSTRAFRVCTALVLPVAVMIGCADNDEVALDNTAAVLPMQSVYAADADMLLAVEQREATAAAGRVAESNAVPSAASQILFFATNDDKVASDDFSRLSQYAEYLTQHPQTTVQVNGHADERGTRAHNAELSERRALQVAAALESFGVPRSQIQTAGYGEDRPAGDPLQWEKNRRVELEYLDSLKVSVR